jgi:hypothetical protein
MGRGRVSKSVRTQNRANLAGNPNRGNPFTGEGLFRGQRRVKERKNVGRTGFQKMIVWENKHYRVAYTIEEGAVNVLGIVCYFSTADSGNYKVIRNDDPITSIICKKLLITLQVEEAKLS